MVLAVISLCCAALCVLAAQEQARLDQVAAAAALRLQVAESGAKQAAWDKERRLQGEELERMRQAAVVSKQERDAAMAQLAERMKAEHGMATQLVERQLRSEMAAQEQQRLETEQQLERVRQEVATSDQAVAERQRQIDELAQSLETGKVGLCRADVLL